MTHRRCVNKIFILIVALRLEKMNYKLKSKLKLGEIITKLTFLFLVLLIVINILSIQMHLFQVTITQMKITHHHFWFLVIHLQFIIYICIFYVIVVFVWVNKIHPKKLYNNQIFHRWRKDFLFSTVHSTDLTIIESICTDLVS